MPFLYGLILLLALTATVTYGLRYLIDYLKTKNPEGTSSSSQPMFKNILGDNRAVILIIGAILSLTFSQFVINYKTYELVLDDPSAIKDTLYVDPLINIEITEQKPRPKPKREIAIEVKESKKPEVDTTKLFTPEDDEPVIYVPIPSDFVPVEKANDEPVLRADVMPRYENGDLDFQRDPNFLKFVSQNFNRNKIREGESGTIYVSFIIEKNGKVSDITILRGMNERLDSEVKRVVSLIPPFSSPAMTNGVPVRLKFNWPFKIK